MDIFNLANYNLDFYNPYFVSGMVNAFSGFLAAIFVFLNNRKDKKNITFFIFSTVVALWAVFFSISILAQQEEVVLFWVKLRMFFLIYLPFVSLFFVSYLLKERTKRLKKIIFVYFLSFTVFFFLNFTSLFVKGVEKGKSIVFWPVDGGTYKVFLVFFVSAMVVALYVLIKEYYRSSGITRQQLQYVIVGFVISLFAGLSNIFGKLGFSFAPYLNMFTSAYVFLIAYAILKYRLFRITPILASKTIIDTMADAIFVVNRDKRIVIVNAATEKILNIQKEKIINKPINEFLLGFEGLENKFLKFLKKKKKVINEGVYLNNKISGEKIPVSISAGLIYRYGIVIICHDIRKIKRQVSLINNQKQELEKIKIELEIINENLEEKVKERTKKLEDFKNNLEKMVADRTLKLEKKNKELTNLNKLMVERELEMIKIKQEINEEKGI